ncbi:MAG: heme NO-binding domain-containing protein [Magnetococcus sp. DMHC-6]
MHGIIFLALEDFLLTKKGEDAWETLLKRVGMQDHIYESDLSYPDQEGSALFAATAHMLGCSKEEMLVEFGRHIIPGLIDLGRSMDIIHSTWKSLDILEYLPKIHTQFSHNNPKIHSPDIRTLRIRHGELAIAYYSDRKLCAFLRGMIVGLGELFKEPLVVQELICCQKEAPLCRMSVVLDDPLLSRYVDIFREFEYVHSRILEINFFNQFNGVPIINSGLVLKYDKKEVMVQTHRDQLAAMSLEERTYLAVPHLPVGLEALVKSVNLKQGTACLHHLSLANGAVGQRGYSRVVPQGKLSVEMVVEGKHYKGHMLNLSCGGVSVSLTRGSRLKEALLFCHVIVSFSLPIKWMEVGDTVELGHQLLEIKGNILEIQESMGVRVVRIVFFPLTKHERALIKHYMQERLEEVLPSLHGMVRA